MAQCVHFKCDSALAAMKFLLVLIALIFVNENDQMLEIESCIHMYGTVNS